MSCEPVFETKSIIVEGFQQRGDIAGTKFLNPNINPAFGNFTPAPGTTKDQFNVYESCMTTATNGGFQTTQLSNQVMEQVSGPSLGEHNKNPGLGYSFQTFANIREIDNVGYAPEITNGCRSGGLGPITGTSLTRRGSYIPDDYGWFSYSSGSGAQVESTLSGGSISSARITNGGNGYKVGDYFETSSLCFSPCPTVPAVLEVTAINDSGSVAKVNWNHAIPTNGYPSLVGSGTIGGQVFAVGDVFAAIMKKPGGSFPNYGGNWTQFNDTPALYEVTAIDVTNTETSSSTLQYTVEKDVTLIYNITANNRVVDLVRDYSNASTTDEVLQRSADASFSKFFTLLGRPPTDIEFQYYTKQIYDNGGSSSSEINSTFETVYADEIASNVVEIRGSCDGDAGEDDGTPGSGSDCVWNRNDFYQGAGTSAGTNVQLRDLWNFLGQPNGPSGPGGGASVEDLVCPKPESGEISDSEPDISDFAGMRLWRWLQCSDGSNAGNPLLGGYEEIIVPCPGPEENCTNPTIEDNLAVYDQGAKVTWNNGESKTGNFVSQAKDEQARAINYQYTSLLGRPAASDGLEYWYDVANATYNGVEAIYWQYCYIRYRDGFESTALLVKTPKNANATAINNKYLEVLGRPAEINGMGVWANEADSIGITKTLQNIELAATNELNRGGIVVIQYGLERTLQLITDVASAPGGELSRGGVSSFTKFCQNQVSSEIDLSFFINTRVPPRYGTITVDKPEISVAQIADTIYFGWSPANQTDNVKGFANSNAIDTVTPYKSEFNNRFTINWPSLVGNIGSQTPPIYVKYVNCVLYQVKDGLAGPINDATGRPVVDLQDYSDSRLEPIVGPKVLRHLGNLSNPQDQPWTGELGGNSPLNDIQPIMSYLPLDRGAISDDEAQGLCFDEAPHRGRKFYWRIKARTYILDPETLQPIPGLTKEDVFSSAIDNQTMRFFSSWGTGTGPVGGTGPTGGPVGGVGPVGGSTCNNLSIACGGDNNLNVETNEPTTIRFNYRVNNASGCNTKGSAKVSIRRWWPCAVFGPPSGRENQWVRDSNNAQIIKRNVPIVDGEAVFNLTVNTSKDDYLAVSYENQTVDDPGTCHWVYVAYWEIDGMSGTSISCNYDAWDNPGCNYQTVFNFLDEVLCVQDQYCEGQERKQILLGPTVETGRVTDFEIINPYPDPRLVETITTDGFPGDGGKNPATVDGNNWNWYYECAPTNSPLEDSQGDLLPNESFEIRNLTSSGDDFYPALKFKRYQNSTVGPGGRVDMTKGCEDSGGDINQWYVGKANRNTGSPPGVFRGGDGYAVGDIVEWGARDQDPSTVTIKIRITQIDVTSSTSDCSQASWANEFSLGEMDPNQGCLPYCSTSQSLKFYWQLTSPQPGVNCSDGSAGGPDSKLTAECSADCPVCEQTIKVSIGDTTECGALKFPSLREGGGPGINNGRVRIGEYLIDNPNTLEQTFDRTKAGVFTRSTQLDGKKVVPITVENWVSVAPATVGTDRTLGKDNAIDFDGVDNQALYDECCPDNRTTFECQDFIGRGNCQKFENGELSAGVDIDCNAKMRVVAQWYYKVEYKTNGVITQTGLLPLPFWKDYNTPDEEKIFNIDTGYYPVSAGNGTNGVAMTYKQETNDGSYYNGSGSTYLPADDTVNKISLYLQIRASNDLWGDPKFDDPPPGFNELDFGTDNDVSSPRPPWNIGTQGPGPKDRIFLIGEFKLGETANLPSPVNWNMSINGCSDAQVYDKVPATDPGEFTCGDLTSDNHYTGRSGYSNTAEYGKANGEEFFRDIYITASACASSVPNFNPKNGSGSKLKPTFCPTVYLPSFTDCAPYSDVRLNVGGIGNVDWGDYNVGGCTTGIKLIWYVNGTCRSNGFISGPTGDGGDFVCYNYASCGEIWEDVSQWCRDASQTYTIEVYAVVNNIDDVAWKNVNRDWSTQNGDPYNFVGGDQRKWKIIRGSNRLPAQIVNAGGVAGEPIVIPPNARWNEGDVFQVILGSASCTVKGNDGSTGKELTGLQAPNFTITSSNETWQGSSSNLPCYTAAERDCCNPQYANNNPTNRCEEEIIGIIYNCCDENLGNGKLTATVQNLPGAWPTIPGTSDRVVGSVTYFWEFRNNANAWVPVNGGTGSVITYVADGKQYRCTVTFDLAGNVPSGYTAKPEKTSKTLVYTVDDVPLELCPDGETYVPVGTPCPDDPGNCNQPERVNGNTAPVFLPTCSNFASGSICTQTSAKNNEAVQVSYLPTFDNFNSVLWVASGTYGVLEYNSIEVASSKSALATFNQGTPTLTFAGSGTVRASNVTRSYTAKFVIKYKCRPADTQVKTTTVRIPNAVRITWSSGGGGPDDDFPKLIAAPTCFYGSGYKSSKGCGSYLGRWQNENGGPFLYYYHDVKNDVNPSNRGTQYSASAVEANAKCDFCPSTTCPQLQITGVNLSPAQPKVGDTVTMQIVYSWDNNGFTETTNPFVPNGETESISWGGPGLNSSLGPRVTIGPFTTNGERNYSITMNKYIEDPGRDCCLNGGIFDICGIINDTFEFTVNIGGDNDDPDPGPDPDPDAEDPEFYNVRITGPSELTLVNGSVTGTWTVGYQLSDGVGYIPNTRPTVMKWDGDSTGKFEDDGGITYSRTFSSPSGAQGINIPVELNKLFCPQDVGASRCISDNILGGSPPLSNAEKKWVVSTPVSKNVVIKGEDVGNEEPTIRTTVTANRTTGVAPVTITFTSTTQVNDGDWVRTPEPAALRYNIVNQNYTTGTINRNATLTQTWTETFNEAFSGTIGARFRRNYCPPGTASTSTCTGKRGFLDNDHVSINITNPGPTGTKPKATINQNVLYLPQEVNGCGFAVADVVEATVTINLTRGTGDYEWDSVETTSGNWEWTGGTTIVQTITRVRPDQYSIDLGTTVVFKKNGQEVHRDATGTVNVCINIIGNIGGPFR